MKFCSGDEGKYHYVPGLFSGIPANGKAFVPDRISAFIQFTNTNYSGQAWMARPL